MSEQPSDVVKPKTAPMPAALPGELDVEVGVDDEEDVFEAPPLAEAAQPVPEPEPMEEPPMVEEAKPVAVPGAQVITRHEIKYPPGYGPKIPGMPGVSPSVPGVPRHQLDALKYFNGLVDDPNAQAYRLQVRRLKPNTWNGYKIFRVDALEDLSPPISIEHLRQMVAETHGGGTFQVKAINANGQCVRMMEFTIDTTSYAPRVPDNSPFVGSLEGRGTLVGPGNSLLGGAETVGGSLRAPSLEIQAVQQAKQVLEVQMQLKQIEKKARDQDKEFKREEERERELEERKAMLPVMQQQQQVEALRNEFRTALDGIKDLVRASVDHKKDDKSIDILLKKMETDAQQNIKSMEIQSQNMTAMFTALAGVMGKKDDKGLDLGTLMQIMNSSNEKMVQMAMQGSSKADRIVEAIITNKLTQPENQLKTAMDFMDRGRSQTMEMMELLQGSEGAGEVINPEGGFWSNLGNVFVHGVSRLVSGAAAGGGGKLMEALSGMTAKPVTGNVYAPTYEPAALPAPAQHQLPAPAAAPAQTVAQAPVVQQPPRAVSPFYDAEMDDDQAYGEPRVAAAPVQQAPAVAQVPAQPVAPVGSDDELTEHVTEAMEQAIRDLDAGRRDPDWPDYALGKWNNSFLVQLAQASDDSARIQLIGTRCDRAVFEQLIQRLRGNTTHVVNFTQGLHVLMQELARSDDVRTSAA